jgi:hypothetical protein
MQCIEITINIEGVMAPIVYIIDLFINADPWKLAI